MHTHYGFKLEAYLEAIRAQIDGLPNRAIRNPTDANPDDG